jgi:hypothetical protein
MRYMSVIVAFALALISSGSGNLAAVRPQVPVLFAA